MAPEIAVVVLAEAARRRDGRRRAQPRRPGLPGRVRAPSAPQLARAVHFAIERKRCEERLVHQALHDPLTGLPNRALFLDRLGAALDRSRRTDASVRSCSSTSTISSWSTTRSATRAGDRLLSSLARA